MSKLVDDGVDRHSGTLTTKRVRSTRRHWLIAASAGAIAAASPGYGGFYSGRARAQTLPAGCADPTTAGTPNDNDGVAENGETVTCVSTADIDGFTTSANDLTIVVGDDTTPTDVNNTSGRGIGMGGTGSLTLSIVNADSSVTGTDRGVWLEVASGAGDLTIESDGKIQGGATLEGIKAVNDGSGATKIDVHDVTGGSAGIYAHARNNSSAGLTVISDGDVNASASNGTGIRAIIGTSGGGATGVLTIDASGGYVSGGGGGGVYARNHGAGATYVTVDDVASGAAITTHAGAGNTKITLTSTADVESTSGHGVFSQSTTGDIELTGSSGSTTGLSGAITGGDTSRGVNLISSRGNITIRNLDSITGGTDGIYTKTQGDGDITVSDVTTITGGAGHGVNAESGGGDISIQGVGVGTGNLVEGKDGHGIRALAGAGNIDIGGVTAIGNVTGSDKGIYAYVETGGGALTIDSSQGDVTGGSTGIHAFHKGDGPVTITVNDVVGGDGAWATGILGRSEQLTAHVTVQGAQGADDDDTVIGGTGIIVSTGANITIQNLDSVTGTSLQGIYASGSIDTITTISGVGTVSGATRGIDAKTFGGLISIQGSGLVGGIEGKSGEGVFANASTFGLIAGVSGGDINIGGVTANGNITATTPSIGTTLRGDGVTALTDGDGTITIAVGSVTTSGDRAGGVRAIAGNSFASGVGDINITTTGAVSTSGSDSIGVLAETAGDGDITVNVDDVSATNSGAIQTRAVAGTTVITLSSTADVESGAGAGVDAASTDAAGRITLQGSSGNVTGATDGAYLQTSGGADITVQTLDGVTGKGGDGLDLYSYGGDITISGVTNITGYGDPTSYGFDGHGVYAVSDGGDISIQDVGVGGLVDGKAGAGIFADAGVGGVNIGGVQKIGNVKGFLDGVYAIITAGGVGDLIIDASTAGATIEGGFGGITALNSGAGETIITTANVKTDLDSGFLASFSDGVYVRNASTAGDMTVNTAAGTVTGGAAGVGVRMDQQGSGAAFLTVGAVSGGTGVYIGTTTGAAEITLTSTANVTGTFGAGVIAQSTGGNISLTGSSGVITGATDGVFQRSGGGTITVQDLDAVTGEGGDGIDAESGGGAITIANITNITGYGDAATSDDDGHGVFAISEGGDISIQGVGGLVDGREGAGIYARAGVGALNIGGVAAVGNVKGSYHGIDAQVGRGGGDLTIDSSAGAVEGGRIGIRAGNYGSGALSITTADVTGGYLDGGDERFGVYAFNGYDATSLTIDTSAGLVTSGYNDAIRANHYGSGPVSIKTDAVNALGGYEYADAIDVNSYSGTDVTIVTTGALSAADDGIEVLQVDDSAGAVSITTLGAVSAGDIGIIVEKHVEGGVTITTADVTGAAGDGVSVYNSDNGDEVTIDASAGSVTGGGTGIFVDQYGGGPVSIIANNVAGFSRAIDVDNHGAGSTTITIAGAVAGETEEGVRAVTRNGATIVVEDGGSVTGAVAAIVADSSVVGGDPTDDALTVSAGGSVAGDVLLNAGEDTFNDAGGSITAVFGGDGLDTVNFTGGARTLTGSGAAGDSIQEFEVFNISSDGLVLAGTHAGLAEANFLAGSNTLTGSLEAAAALIAPGATLNAADGSELIGMLTNNGTLNVGDSPGTFTVDGDLVLGATSVLPIEVGATSDLIVVTGDITLGGAIDVITLEGTPLGVSTRTIISGGAGLSGAFDVVNAGNGLLISQAVDVDPAGFGVLLTTTVNPASSVDGLGFNQAAAGDNLIGLLSDPSLDPGLLDLINAVGAIGDVDALQSTLEQLTPEGLDPGLKFLTTSQSRFIDVVLEQASMAGVKTESIKVASLSGAPVGASADGVATAWGVFEAYGLSQGAGADHVGFDGTAFSFSAGVSGIAAGPVSFGVAGGYSNFDGDTDGALGDAADASLFHIAGIASARFGVHDFDTRADTIIAYATGDNEVAMNLFDPSTDAAVSQRGDAGVSSIDWAARLTLDGKGGEDWALKPYLQTGVTVYRQDAVDLGAAGATALAVDDLDNTRWQIGVGATYERRIDDRLSVNARGAVVQYFGGTDNAFDSRFAAAPAGAASFRTAGKELDRQIQLDAALAYEHKSGFVFSIGAFGDVGDLNLYGGNLRVRKRF